MYDEEFLCSLCIEDEDLKSWIEEKGEEQICKFCEASRRSILLDDLAIKIHEVFILKFRPTLSSCGKEGAVLIGELIGADSAIADKLLECLIIIEDTHFKYRQENIYSLDKRYEHSNSPKFLEELINRQIGVVRYQIQHEERFFSKSIEKKLEEMLKGTEKQRRILKAGTKIYRGRRAENEEVAEEYIENPAKIHSPPSHKSIEGRMNPTGISVFYGAMDLTTCIIEVGKDFRDYVIVGTFELKRPLKVFVFEDPKDVDFPQRPFNAQQRENYERSIFFKAFHKEITKPLREQEKTFYYIFTQVVAEYLRTFLSIDAILYKSSYPNAGFNLAILHPVDIDIDKLGIPLDPELKRGYIHDLIMGKKRVYLELVGDLKCYHIESIEKNYAETQLLSNKIDKKRGILRYV